MSAVAVHLPSEREWFDVTGPGLSPYGSVVRCSEEEAGSGCGPGGGGGGGGAGSAPASSPAAAPFVPAEEKTGRDQEESRGDDEEEEEDEEDRMERGTAAAAAPRPVHGRWFEKTTVPDALNMPPTPWQTLIFAPGTWAGAVPRICRTLSCRANMPYMPVWV